MAWVNLILNLAGLTLWSNWLAIHFDPLSSATAASLAGTLKRAEASRQRRWKYLSGLLALLLVRAWLCRQIGAAVDWTPKLNVGVTILYFRNDSWLNVLLFSFLSFGAALAIFYLCLLLLSVANGSVPDSDPWQKLVRLHVKWIEHWPSPMKAALPFILGGLSWMALHPLLSRMGIVPGNKSTGQLFGQATAIGVVTYFAWAGLVLVVLLLHLLNSYVYLGNQSLWNYADTTARNFLLPLRRLPLRFGKVDLLPVAVILLLVLLDFLIARPPERWRVWLYQRLPF